jgi:serine/threonine-protein kinase
VYGTADYIAPEVAMGLGEYGAEADVYSLGCALFKLLTGKAPFEGGDHDSFVSKMHAHVSEPRRSVGRAR